MSVRAFKQGFNGVVVVGGGVCVVGWGGERKEEGRFFVDQKHDKGNQRHRFN